ncbi:MULTISPECIES: hypothetical protein [unclassified Clostridium]|uniref:hypothetical protein n=1 Tax=Clostridium TaxID=1485 RepID=UPI001C8C1CC3|nr:MULTISPECIES: hypothetical protein [unclassified Clostridium]MBX9138367.1 hypothetical protein [Clostridium sp. K12(2020)]MBX9145083.1 hypothetical protein [Clostridium sp. K13]MDU2290696.1 hypothetical protein [Clostridium celatum]
MTYSKKIIFEDTKVKNNKFKLTLVIIMFFILITTFISTYIYKEIVTPTPINFQDINELLMDYNVTDPMIYKKTKDFMPQPLSYVSNINLIDAEYINFNTLNAPISMTLNYSTGRSECLATAEIQYKYKKGWFIKDFIDIKTDNFIPLFSAGDILLDILTDSVYFEDGFSFNNINYEYTKSYIDSLYVISEEGDTSSTTVKVGSFDTGRAVHLSATLSYNFDEGTWDLIDYAPTVYDY